MGLVPAKCTQCGGDIEVDSTKEAAICMFCGTAFITEKAINKYNSYTTNNININSSGNIVNIIDIDDKDDDKFDEYLRVARLSRDNGDDEKTLKFYNLVLEIEPQNWEAIFFSTCSSVYINTTVGNIPSGITKIKSTLGTVMELLKENTNRDEVIDSLLEIVEKLNNMSLDFYNSVSEYFSKYRLDMDVFQYFNTATFAITNLMFEFGDQIESDFDDNSNERYSQIYVESWKSAITIRKEFFSCYPVFLNVRPEDNKSFLQKQVNKYSAKIQKFEPSYVAPKAKACYVATCVYGSYDCPEVWTLRRFRDFTLDKTWYGRLFIKCYYKVSPKIVKLFGKKRFFVLVWKNVLDKMVKKLNDKGIENTTYNDKY